MQKKYNKKPGEQSVESQQRADSQGSHRNIIIVAFLWSPSNCAIQVVEKQHKSRCLHFSALTGIAAVTFWHFYLYFIATSLFSLAYVDIWLSSFRRWGEQQNLAPSMQHTKPHILDLGLPPLIYLFKLFALCQTGVSSLCWKFSLCAGHWHCLQKQLPITELQNTAVFCLDDDHFCWLLLVQLKIKLTSLL